LHPSVGLVGSDWKLIDEHGTVVGRRRFDVPAVRHGYDYIEQTLRAGRSSVALSGAMVRRDALGSVRFADFGFAGYEDFVVWFRLAERADVGHVAAPLWRYRLHPGSLSRGAILRMTRQYREVLRRYCDDHLQRHPDRAPLVARWRRLIDDYLFWALVYETARHFRRGGGPGHAERSLFDLDGYALTPEEFRDVQARLREYRAGPLQHATCAMVSLLVRARWTAPLGWLTRYSDGFRALLGLR